MDIQQLAADMFADSERWFPEACNDLMVLTLGINGEAGEVADLVKKIARGSIALEQAIPLIKEELVDVLIYVLCCMQVLQMDIIDEYNKKRQYNENRFNRDQNIAKGRDNGTER